jgi:hypothetical protein
MPSSTVPNATGQSFATKESMCNLYQSPDLLMDLRELGCKYVD